MNTITKEISEPHLIFDGVEKTLIKTERSIELKNKAKIGEVIAGKKISAYDCSSLGRLHSNEAIHLFNCCVIYSESEGEIYAENCKKVGVLKALKKIDLKNCKLGSAHTVENLYGENCMDCETFSANGNIILNHSIVKRACAKGSIALTHSTIQEYLEVRETSTLVRSTVKTIVVSHEITKNDNQDKKRIENHEEVEELNVENQELPFVKLILEDTKVENIRFTKAGIIILKGNSKIHGNIFNAKIEFDNFSV